MDLYPQTPVPSEASDFSDEFKTIDGGDWENGAIASRPARLYPKYSASLIYSERDFSEFYALYEFFMSQRGRSGRFAFADFNGHDASPVGIAWPKLLVGVGTGAQTAWDLPMMNSSGYDTGASGGDPGYGIFVDGTRRARGTGATEYAFASGTGANGRDKVTFVTAPTAGQIIEWRATGRRVVQARFVVDKATFQSFTNMITKTGLQVEEVRW